MTFEFRMPTLTAQQPEAAIREMQSYLFQLKEQLQFAMVQVDTGMQTVRTETAQQIQTAQQDNTPAKTFGRIKDLIIKSADIVDRYSEVITTKLEGQYVAQSDFGIFREETSQAIEQTDTAVTQIFNNVQNIESLVAEIEDTQAEMNAYIRTGMIYEDEQGIPRYGVEIGEQRAIDGEVNFQRYARLTSDKLSFFDQNQNEVAYISDRKMHITEAECQTMTADSITIKQLRFGDYVWNLGSDGHLTLM